jgi:hypothetical protein
LTISYIHVKIIGRGVVYLPLLPFKGMSKLILIDIPFFVIFISITFNEIVTSSPPYLLSITYYLGNVNTFFEVCYNIFINSDKFILTLTRKKGC